ncbi:hypothetical protein BH23ACT9_BH23ACT9_37190 [soil metagenome]
MRVRDTYRRQLRTAAYDQYGYVTTSTARDLGIPPDELRQLAHRGGLTRLAYGLYRFDEIPRTGLEQYMEAVLRVGDDAYLTHDAVLAVHELADVNPTRYRVGTPHRVRRTLPKWIEVIRRDLRTTAKAHFEGIPTSTVEQAIRDCRPLVMRERLLAAANEARRRGLILRRPHELLVAELEQGAEA